METDMSTLTDVASAQGLVNRAPAERETEISRITLALSECIARVTGAAGQLQELGDRMYGPRPEEDMATAHPVRSGSVGVVHDQFDALGQRISELEAAIARLSEIA